MCCILGFFHIILLRGISVRVLCIDLDGLIMNRHIELSKNPEGVERETEMRFDMSKNFGMDHFGNDTPIVGMNQN